MSMLSATLTLPGIAGIVLTVGMAVDANVLIFSRIKEELKNGLPPQSAINAGFKGATTTIFDANITTRFWLQLFCLRWVRGLLKVLRLRYL